MREVLEALIRRLLPFDSELDEPLRAVLAYVERRLGPPESLERAASWGGVGGLDGRAQARFGCGFALLDPGTQDALLGSLEAEPSLERVGRAGSGLAGSGPGGSEQPEWLATLIRWVAEATYAEPGPARRRAWRALGYPEDHALPVPGRAAFSTSGRRPAKSELDAIVIGAGVSGCIVAGVLARAGLTVLVLERGDDAYSRAVERQHLQNHRLSLYGHNTGPGLDDNPRVLIDAEGRARTLRPHENGYHNNAVGVGGGGLVFGGMAWRFRPEDFGMASRYGVPRGSSLSDWPLSYSELAPFYARAEWEVGVAGEPNACLGAAGAASYPMPPHAGHPGRARLAAGARVLGWRPHGVPLAINSAPRAGRSPCVRCNSCVGFACPSDSKNGGYDILLHEGLQSGRVSLRTQATVQSIDTDGAGRVVGVSYHQGLAERATTERLRARVVIVACGAIESARLLLDSPSGREPRGLGNDRDQVGRHLQGHVYAGATGLMPEPVEDGRGPGPSVAVSDFCHDNPGIIGGGLLSDDFVLLPIVAWRDHLPPGVARWGSEGGRVFQRDYRRLLKVTGPIQEIPNPESRVSLDPHVRDGLGRRVARLSGTVHAESVRSAEFLRLRAEEWLWASGAERVWSHAFGAPTFLSAGQHQSGTCRMGDDPESSVVDPWGRVHGHDNLYVIDASTHVTNGCVNPVLTVMALGLRNGEALARAHG